MITENMNSWAGVIKESFGITDPVRLGWMSRYAQIHNQKEILESQQSTGVNVSNGLFATPLNTMGLGNPTMPYLRGQNGANGNLGNTGADFHSPQYQPGSGDIPNTTLPIAMTIAATTIAFDLVPVVPAAGPVAWLQYFDTPYGGGKLGGYGLTSLDGRGKGQENKPLYIKVSSSDVKTFTNFVPADKKDVTITSNYEGVDYTLKGEYAGKSRIDNGLLLRVIGIYKGEADATEVSIADIFSVEEVSIEYGELTAKGRFYPQFVDANSDHIQEFQNFVDVEGRNPADPMTRGENETGTGNTVGARMFTKMVQMGSYEVTGTVTRQQLQDMPIYGIDVVGKVIEQMQNRISQAINNRILDRLFKLGATNADIQQAYQSVNLNASFTEPVDGKVPVETVSLPGIDDEAVTFTAKNLNDSNDSFSYVNMQRRISSRVHAAANIIANVSRRGRGNFIVTNTQIATLLQDAAGYNVNPMINDLTQDGTKSLYHAGSIAGLQLYVDPNMRWDDTRVLVGRRGAADEPGVVFMPYILADTVQTIVEGTMAPKILINSRFAIVDAGFYPEQSYFTFKILGTEGLI
jgi:hypothetical protein